MSALLSALESLSKADAKTRGAVFTRPEVVAQMLDLLGYTPEADLRQFRLLEPCFGEGEFVLGALDRLMESYLAHGGSAEQAEGDLAGALCGVELHSTSYQQVIHRVIHSLGHFGLTKPQATRLAQGWLRQGDFLLTEFERPFSHVVGNPPYVRLEQIQPDLLAEYRQRYPTLTHRADVFVAFFERGLDLLQEQGKLAYICANRWIKNRYGSSLRQKIAEGFHLQSYLELGQQEAFQTKVTAYPAITVLSKSKGRFTQVHRPPHIELVKDATPSGQPWLLGLGSRLNLLRRLESQFLPLEQSGCRVGIGIATGADKVFISQHADVEPQFKLPLLLAQDVRLGEVQWSGHWLVSPFEDGQLADLERWPKLAAYLHGHRAALQTRYIARKNPRAWYRTIDPIHPHLLLTPKLLLPDLTHRPLAVLDAGQFYPHHNLYWVTSQEWPLPALQTVLASRVAWLFIQAYSVEMRGGYYRCQAQNLRKIRLPLWSSLPTATQARLLAGEGRAVGEAYELDASEIELL